MGNTKNPVCHRHIIIQSEKTPSVKHQQSHETNSESTQRNDPATTCNATMSMLALYPIGYKQRSNSDKKKTLDMLFIFLNGKIWT